MTNSIPTTCDDPFRPAGGRTSESRSRSFPKGRRSLARERGVHGYFSHTLSLLFTFFSSLYPFIRHPRSLYLSPSAHGVDERETSRTEKRAPVAASMTLSRVSRRRVPRFPPLSFRCFPHGQRGHVPVVMETRANRDGNSAGTLSISLSLSLCPISLSLALPLGLSLSPFLRRRFSPSSRPNLLTPSTCQSIRVPLSPSFPNYLSLHRAPSYQLDSPGGLSILYSPIVPLAKSSSFSPSPSPPPAASRPRLPVARSR